MPPASKLTIVATVLGICAFTDKTESDGLTIALENETPQFVSRKAFKKLLPFRIAQVGKLVAPLVVHANAALALPA